MTVLTFKTVYNNGVYHQRRPAPLKVEALKSIREIQLNSFERLDLL